VQQIKGFAGEKNEENFDRLEQELIRMTQKSGS